MTGDAATFDEDLLMDGLWLSLIGMGVVFAVLSLLAITIKVFDRLDALLPAEGTAGISGQPASTTAPSQPAEATSAPDDAETAAAIGVALALADSQTSRGSTRSTTGPAANSWLTAGRSREMSSRMSGLPGRIRKIR